MINCDIYMETEKHPSGYWFNIVDEHGTTDGEAIVLDMDGPFPTERACNASGELALCREIGSGD